MLSPGRTGTLCAPHRAARGRRAGAGGAQARARAGDRRGRARRAGADVSRGRRRRHARRDRRRRGVAVQSAAAGHPRDAGRRRAEGRERRGGDRAAQSACGGRDACGAAHGRERARSRCALRSRRRRLGQFRDALSGVRCVLLREEAAGDGGGRHVRRHAHDHPGARARRRTASPIRPIAACFPSRRRRDRCRPARKPAFSARSPACSAR